MRIANLARLAAGVSLLLPLNTAGCQVGRWNQQDITSPSGATATIRNNNGRSEGELLMVRDDGAVVRLEGRIVLARWRDMSSFHVEAGLSVDLYGRRAPSPEQRETLRRLSRYPYGLTDDQLTALLESVGQTDIPVLQ